MKYSYEIISRPVQLGGGWRLRLLEDEEEVGGGVFPPVEDIENTQLAVQSAFDDAESEAYAWLDTRKKTSADSDVAERQRRQTAVAFALANVGLSGFAPSEDARDQMRRFIHGKIDIDEFINGWCIALKNGGLIEANDLSALDAKNMAKWISSGEK